MSKKLFKSTLGFASWTLLSRILGLVREMVFASLFGATMGMDAFLVAFKIPNFFRRLFAEGAFTQAFVPFLSTLQVKQSETEVKELIQVVSGTLATVVFLVAAVGMLLSSLVILLFVPGFYHHPYKWHLASQLLTITFPYIAFISMAALSSSILNTLGYFSVQAATPLILNVCLIGGALGGYYGLDHSIYGCAYGVLLAGILQWLFQWPFLAKGKLWLKPKIAFNHPGVRQLLRLMVPAIYGASVVQISLLIDTVFASFLPTGSISWLYFADRLMQFPLGVFGVALSTVVLPHLSRANARDHQVLFNKTVGWAMTWVAMVAIPAAVGLAVLSGPILATLFHHGAFNAEDVAKTQSALIAFSVGLLFFIAVKVLVSTFYAQQDMKTPVKIASVALILNVILNAVLIGPLAHVGLALATSLTAVVNAVCLLWVLAKRSQFDMNFQKIVLFLKFMIAAIIMGWALYVLRGSWATWLMGERLLQFGHLMALIIGGAVIYLLLLWCMRVKFKQSLFFSE